MEKARLIVFTVALWLIAVVIHAGYLVFQARTAPGFDGYEREPFFAIAGFLFYWFRYWLAGLIFVIALELIVPEIYYWSRTP